MKEKGQQKMYVAISAYEDEDIIKTLLDCRNAADDPEDIVFGIGIKYKEEPDFSVIKNYFKQKNDTSDYPNDVMPGEIQVFKGLLDMVTQEDYILKISCGYEFANGWDTQLKQDIKELEKYGKYVISGHLSDKCSPFVLDTKWEMSENYETFNLSSTAIKSNSELIKNKEINNKYFISHYLNSNFFFAKTEWIKAIKFPTYHRSAWQDQELSISNYCYGYDIASPTTVNSVIFFNNLPGKGKKRMEDAENSKSNVVKLLIRGKNRLFDVTESIRSIESFYKDIGLEDLHTRMKAEMDQWIYDIANEIRIKQ
jgi:hypothetical protein